MRIQRLLIFYTKKARSQRLLILRTSLGLGFNNLAQYLHSHDDHYNYISSLTLWSIHLHMDGKVWSDEDLEPWTLDLKMLSFVTILKRSCRGNTSWHWRDSIIFSILEEFLYYFSNLAITLLIWKIPACFGIYTESSFITTLS